MEWECRGQTLLFPERPQPSCGGEGVKMKLHGQVENPDYVILSGDCRVLHVCVRQFICLLVLVHMSANWSTCFISVFLGPYHRNTTPRSDNRCCGVMIQSKVVRTQEDMSSRTSVDNQWPFEYYFQSLCRTVMHDVWNHTKMESWSFPMILFVWSTVWCSLVIFRLSWIGPADTLNSWSSWLWSRGSSPFPPSPPIMEFVSEICCRDGQSKDWPNLSTSTKVGESWFTIPGTKICWFVLFQQLDLSLMFQLIQLVGRVGPEDKKKSDLVSHVPIPRVVLDFSG